MGRVSSNIPKNLLTAVGDMIYASAVGTPSRLAAGATGIPILGQGAGVAPVYNGAIAPTTVAATDATDATSTTAAAMKTAGGLAVAKKGFFGDLINVAGKTQVSGNLGGGTAISTISGGLGPSGEYTNVADDGKVSIFGTGAASPGGGFSGLLLVHAYATTYNPVNGEEANVAALYIQTGSGTSSAKFISLHTGTNVQVVLNDNADSALANVTDGKLGIVIGGGGVTRRYIHIYNRLGGVYQIGVTSLGVLLSG